MRTLIRLFYPLLCLLELAWEILLISVWLVSLLAMALVEWFHWVFFPRTNWSWIYKVVAGRWIFNPFHKIREFGEINEQNP